MLSCNYLYYKTGLPVQAYPYVVPPAAPGVSDVTLGLLAPKSALVSLTLSTFKGDKHSIACLIARTTARTSHDWQTLHAVRGS